MNGQYAFLTDIVDKFFYLWYKMFIHILKDNPLAKIEPKDVKVDASL